MNNSKILSSSNYRILRNGKIITLRKHLVKKKKKIPSFKKDEKSSLLKITPSKLNRLKFINNKMSREIILTNDFGHLVDNRSLYMLLKKMPSLINSVQFNNNISNKSCYTNLEEYIELNELQIYNALQPKVESNVQLITKVNSEQKVIPLQSVNKNKNVKTNFADRSTSNQNTDVRMTRGKTIKLQREERRQLDKIIFDKFPNNTFKILDIQLDDITEEVKFLRTLGLICRFKCPLSPVKLKSKP